MAKTPTPPAAGDTAGDLATQAAAPVGVRVLQACCYGACGTVAQCPAAELDAAKAAGLVDDHPDAVAYVRGLAAAPADQA